MIDILHGAVFQNQLLAKIKILLLVNEIESNYSEHFIVVQDIIDALSHQEMKEREDQSEDYPSAPSPDELSKSGLHCDSCQRISELRRILFSIYCVAIESLLSNTDLATERLSEDALRRSRKDFLNMILIIIR